jgi:hypothetical protein
MALTETQAEALTLIYMQDFDAIVPGLHGAIDELVSLGLAAGPAEGWTVTIEGRRLAERLTDE